MPKYSRYVLPLVALPVLLNACSMDRLRYEVFRAPKVKEQQEFARSVAEMVKNDQSIFERQQSIPVGTNIPSQFVPGQVEGEWSGTACHDQIRVSYKLRMMSREPIPRNLFNTSEMGTISGELQASGISRSASATLETGLEGSFDESSGFLQLRASPRLAEFLAKEQDMETRLEWEAKKSLDEAHGKHVTRDTLDTKLREIETLTWKEHNRLQNVEQEIRRRYQRARDVIEPFTITLTRDEQGKGWAGVIEGKDFGECEITVMSVSKRRTEKLPPITSAVALKKVNDLFGTRGAHTLASRHWLDLAAKDAKFEDFALLGLLFERDGDRSPEQNMRAEKFYRAANEIEPDARAQEGLGRLYTSRLVPSGSVQEGHRLSRLAEDTKAKAQAVCESPQFRQAFGLMAMKIRAMHEGYDALADALKNPSIEPLKLLDVQLRATDVKSMERQFVCVTSIPRPKMRQPKGSENDPLGDQIFRGILLWLYNGTTEEYGKKHGDIWIVTTVNAAGSSRYKLAFYIQGRLQESAIIDVG